MTRDTDGKPKRLTVLNALNALVAHLKFPRKWPAGELEAGADFPDERHSKRAMSRTLVALVVLLAGAGLWLLFANGGANPGDEGASRPAVATRGRSVNDNRPAATHPAVAGKLGPIPDGYHILLSRSIFARNGAPMSEAAGPAPAVAPATLKGITQEDTRFTAYIEAAGRMLQLREGDSLAAGRIKRITLHAIEYAVDGRLARVEIGQPLNARTAITGTSPALDSTENASAPSGPRPAPDRQREAAVFAGEPPR